MAEYNSAAFPPNPALAKRVKEFYRRIHAQPATASNEPQHSMWTDFDQGIRKPIHDLLMTGSDTEVLAMLSDPAAHDLFYGFDALCLQQTTALLASPSFRAADAALIGSTIQDLGSVLGVKAEGNPDQTLDAVDKVLSTTLDFPVPFPSEMGFESRRGVISYRPPQAIYQAWRLSRLRAGSVLEIGAGLGRTAYYANRLGMTDYTIVDLPLTAVAQGYFLGLVLGDQNVKLYGEPGFDIRGGVRIAPPNWLAESDDAFDVGMNIDSLTEMDRRIAEDYLRHIFRRCRTFLSVNHEVNSFTVTELLREAGVKSTKEVYPMRNGYFEEVVQLR